jgi:hypothetical protein
VTAGRVEEGPQCVDDDTKKKHDIVVGIGQTKAKVLL